MVKMHICIIQMLGHIQRLQKGTKSLLDFNYLTIWCELNYRLITFIVAAAFGESRTDIELKNDRK